MATTWKPGNGVRNNLGQKIEVGVPVLLVSQGQGWTDIRLGRVEKFSSKGMPQIRYAVGNDEGREVSPPIQRPERLFVVDEGQFKELVEVHKIVRDAGESFDLSNPIEKYDINAGSLPYDAYITYRRGYDDRRERRAESRKRFINAALEAAGKEKYYD